MSGELEDTTKKKNQIAINFIAIIFKTRKNLFLHSLNRYSFKSGSHAI